MYIMRHCHSISSFSIEKEVTPVTLLAIFAYGHSDPTSEDTISYHGTTRGTKSMSLLSKVVAPQNFPDDVLAFDFLNNDVS